MIYLFALIIILIILNFKIEIEIRVISLSSSPRVFSSDPHCLIHPFGNISSQFSIRFLPLSEEGINLFQ